MSLDDIAERLKRLEDRVAIGEVIIRYANALDSCDYVEMRSLLADEVLMDFDYMAIPAQTFDANEWCDFARAALSELKCTHHLSPNHVLTRLERDAATCRSAMFAQHWLPNDRGGDEFLMRGHYVNELARGSDGWRITAMKQVTTWTSGNSQIFDLVMGNPGPSVTPRRA